MSKILEKIIYIRLLDHFTTNNLLSDKQFGFRKGLSTYMPILLIQDLIATAFEANELIVGVFLDLKKAFDTVDHDILCQKLKKYGVKDNSHDIISSYLNSRMQTVSIRGSHADFKRVNIGVPQGSILGPLLFIIYINDLASNQREVDYFIYADDTAIFFKHRDPDVLQCIVNAELLKVSQWLQVNYLSLNVSKTFYQLYTNRKINVSIRHGG